MKISKLINFSLVAILAASCTQTDLFEGAADMSGMVDYSLYAGRPTSRATVLDNTNFKTFKVYSYQNIENTGTPGTFDFSAYYDETVEKNTTWAGPRPRRWATGANDFLNFYAYSDEANASNYVAATGVAAHASFDYTVPAAAADQQDLLVSAAFSQQEKTNQGKLNLDFKHALTQVAFKVKSATPSFEVKVSKVELIGANSKGTFGYDGTINVVGAWSAAGTAADYAFDVETPAEIDNADFVAIESATGNLMMIPDAAPSTVKIRVTYNLVVAGVEDTEELVKEIELKEETVADGTTVTNPITPWTMGKKITYNLTLPGKANKIIFGDATMTEDWDATEEETNAEAKDILGVSFITLTDGLAYTAGYPLEINDNRVTAGGFVMTSDATWVKFSETANDFAGAQTTLTSTTVTRVAATKTVYIYADFNATGAKRTATITMTRNDYSVVTLEITQDVLANDKPFGDVTEVAITDADLTNGVAFTYNETRGAAYNYTITSGGAWLTISDKANNAANAQASFAYTASGALEETKTLYVYSNDLTVRGRTAKVTLQRDGLADVTLDIKQAVTVEPFVIFGEAPTANKSVYANATTTSHHDKVAGGLPVVTVKLDPNVDLPYYQFVISTNTVSKNRDDAFTYCKALAPVGKWRVPRASEVTLIAVNATALKNNPKWGSFEGYVLSGTTIDAGYYRVSIPGSDWSITPLATAAGLRCVREVTQ